MPLNYAKISYNSGSEIADINGEKEVKR